MLDDEIVLFIQFINSKTGARSTSMKFTQKELNNFIIEHFDDEQKEEQLILLIMSSKDETFSEKPLITCNQFLGVINNV